MLNRTVLGLVITSKVEPQLSILKLNYETSYNSMGKADMH